MIEASQHSSGPSDRQPLMHGLGIHLGFGEGFLLEKVNFQVYQGESLVIIGPSGHGKSLLLKIFAGLQEPQKGQIFVEGLDWKSLSITQRNYHFRQRGMLFQRNALFDSLTALENVRFPLQETTQLSSSEIQKRAVQILESVGLEKAAHLYPDEMSGGMQKRLGIARALILEPPILINDDPIAGLDPITSKKIIELIIAIKKRRNMTVISVLNDINRAFQLATRLLIVIDKNVIDLGTPQEARSIQDIKVQKFLRGEPI